MSVGRVAVTGASGFIGRNLVPMLGARGIDVDSVSRADATGRPSDVVRRITSGEPEVIVHLATHFLATHTADDIPELVRSNVEFGAVVAQAASSCRARLVIIGSAWQHFEGRDYDPVSLYAATKQALSVVTAYYSRVAALDLREVTLFDTYGIGDTRPKLVPKLLEAARTGSRVELSDGHQLIDLTYVDDICSGICIAATDDECPESTVLRSWQPITIRDLVRSVEAVTGRDLDIAWGARPARSREMLADWKFGSSPQGWAPRIGLDEGLSRVWKSLGNTP